MITISIPLSDELRNFAEGQVARHGYRSVAEYVATLVQQAAEQAASENGSASASSSVWDIAAKLRSAVPAGEWDKVPADLARNFDHYHYGHSRED